MKDQIVLTEELRKELVINALNDAIIFNRTATVINMLQKVGSHKDGFWDAEMHIYGMANAYYLLGISLEPTREEEGIIDILDNIFENSIRANESRAESAKRTAKELAEEILKDWEPFLKAANISL